MMFVQFNFGEGSASATTIKIESADEDQRWCGRAHHLLVGPGWGPGVISQRFGIDFPFLSCHQGEDVRFASTEYHCPPRHLLKSNTPCEDFPLAVPVSLPRPSVAEGGLTSRSVNNQWRFENLTPLPGPMSPWVHLRKGLVSQSFSHIWDRSHTWVQLRGDGRYGSQERSYRRQGEDTH